MVDSKTYAHLKHATTTDLLLVCGAFFVLSLIGAFLIFVAMQTQPSKHMYMECVDDKLVEKELGEKVRELSMEVHRLKLDLASVDHTQTHTNGWQREHIYKLQEVVLLLGEMLNCRESIVRMLVDNVAKLVSTPTDLWVSNPEYFRKSR